MKIPELVFISVCFVLDIHTIQSPISINIGQLAKAALQLLKHSTVVEFRLFMPGPCSGHWQYESRRLEAKQLAWMCATTYLG